MRRIRRVVLDLDTQTADIHVHDLKLADIMVAPDHLKQLIARERLADVLHKRFQKAVFNLRQLDFDAVFQHLARTQVELERAGLDHVLL